MRTPSATLAGPVPREISFQAIVTSQPSFFIGRRTQTCHETFGAQTTDGARLQIIDNVDLAPRIPVVPGDRITVRGELVMDRSGGPVVHWTHHDPAQRHPGGWIDLHGRRYA